MGATARVPVRGGPLDGDEAIVPAPPPAAITLRSAYDPAWGGRGFRYLLRADLAGRPVYAWIEPGGGESGVV